MATRSATVKYASRSAVSGSNAYDLSRIREYAHEPMRKPGAAPVRQPAEKIEPRTVKKPVRNAARQTHRANGISLFAVTGFIVVAVMMVFVLLANVRYNEIAGETVRLQERFDELTEQERKLKIAYEEAFDVNAVEQYATSVLGMTKPDESQMGTVQTTAPDKAVIVTPEKEDAPISESMVAFLASLVSYFK